MATLYLKTERKSKGKERGTTDSKIMKKDAIIALRDKFFSKSVSISYANSNPLMIMKVRRDEVES